MMGLFGIVSVAGFIGSVIFCIWVRHRNVSTGRNGSQPYSLQSLPLKSQSLASAYDDITPLPDFEWRTTEPMEFRNFKEKYHLTMGLTTSTISELIVMDKNYLSRLDIRKQVIRDHGEIALQASPRAKPAVDELYTWLVSTYLPSRFPTMFSKTEKGTMNDVTGELMASQPDQDPIHSLQTLGENLDEEFLLLLPSDDGDGYTLKAYVTCFPSGFNTLEKFNLKLRDIHKPVPRYKEKLELSMDRYFDRLEIGKFVMRSNWAISTTSRLFVPSGNHLYAGEIAEEVNINIEDTHLRCERQMLWRLPETKAIVFSFKTYMYPLQEIKDEGLGEELTKAIDGLKEGSVPAMHFYKKGVVWGDSVKEFLRA